MITKYGLEVTNEILIEELKKFTNRIYKLLPNREEGLEWKKPLSTVIEELSGLQRLLTSHQLKLFTLICKLEGLFTLDSENDFFIFRRTIFDCLNLIGELIIAYESK
jgi:hypothetical protein